MTENLPADKAEPKPQDTVAYYVAAYRGCRETIKRLNDEHEAKIKPLTDLQDMLTGWLQDYLEQAGADSIKTPNGTAYNTTRYTASLADSEAFMKFVLDNKQYDLLDRKANVTAVRAYVEEHSVLPPGVNLSSHSTVGVRAPTRSS
jgi:hypothetical protein